MNNNITDLLNEQEIKTDIMRYKNNGTSFWLSMLAIITNVVMFVIIYKKKECVPDFQMGFDLLINVVFMLATFLIAEKTKAYSKKAAYAAIIIAIIQVARIVWIPLFYYQCNLEYQSYLAGEIGKYTCIGLSLSEFITCSVLIVVSALCLVAAAIVAIAKNKKLEAHLKKLEEMR